MVFIVDYNKIINYFIDKEANTPPVVLLNNYKIKNNKKYNSIINSENSDLNWDIKPNMNHIVYLGVISAKNIKQNIKGNFYTYLISFEIDNDGYPIINSLNIPQYLINIVHKKNNAQLEIGKNSQFYEFLNKEFHNWVDILKKIGNRTNIEDIEKLFSFVLDLIEIYKEEEFVSLAYIESSINKNFDSFKENELLINDLINIKNKGIINNSALDNLFKENNKKIDVINDIRNIKKIIEPRKMNYSSWANVNDEALVLSEQVAVNLLFNDIKYNEKIFSITSPSFVSNNETLKEIIANIFLNKFNETIEVKKANESIFKKINEVKIDNEIFDIFETNKDITDLPVVLTSKNKENLKNKKEILFEENYFGKNLVDYIIGFDMDEDIDLTKIMDFLKVDEIKTTKEIYLEINKKINSISLLNKKIEENTLSEIEFDFFKSSCDLELFNENIDKLHKMSLFNQKEIKALKSDIFLEILSFNKELILENKNVFIDTIKLIKKIKDGKINDKYLIKNIWKTFSFFFPVLISSNSNFDFNFFNQEDIGWLIVDDAESFNSYELIGSIWRSKNVVLFGDLNGCKNIKYNDYSYNDFFNEKYNLSNFDINCSLLDIANRINKFGEYSNNGWISCPIKISKEKSNINKKILNKLLYKNNIIINENEEYKTEIYSILGGSFWFNIENDEYDFIKYQLKTIFENQSEYTMPDIHIVSPYNDIINNIKEYLKKEKDAWITEEYPFSEDFIDDWIEDHVINLNRLQTKKINSAFFVLGNEEKNLDWTKNESKIISLLFNNIKENTYIIANKKIWDISALKRIKEILN